MACVGLGPVGTVETVGQPPIAGYHLLAQKIWHFNHVEAINLIDVGHCSCERLMFFVGWCSILYFSNNALNLLKTLQRKYIIIFHLKVIRMEISARKPFFNILKFCDKNDNFTVLRQNYTFNVSPSLSRDPISLSNSSLSRIRDWSIYQVVQCAL